MQLYKAKYKGVDGKKITADSWRLDFIDHMEIRRRWPLGIKNRKTAEAIRAMIEGIVSHKASGQPFRREQNEWIEDACPQDLRRRMADIGLIAIERAAGGRGLSELIDAFSQWIENQGNTAKQAQQQKARVSRVFMTKCQFSTFSDIDAGKVSKALAAMRTGPDAISSRTANFHLQACQQFCKWAVRNKLASTNPIEHLTPMKRDKSEERKRRALTADEVGRLLNVTAGQPERFNMAGHERALLYRLSVETGLRYSETRSLTAGDFDLNSQVVTIRGENAKNRQTVSLPLRQDLIELLRVQLAGKMPTAKAFNMPRVSNASKIFKLDAEAAGIDTADNGSGGLCFHALRHTFGSLLAASGVHPKVAQELMRHSNFNLTMSGYSHTYRGQLSDAIRSLPSFDHSPGQEAQRKTGTDDCSDTGPEIYPQGVSNSFDVTLDVKQTQDTTITDKYGGNKDQTEKKEMLEKPHFQEENSVFEVENAVDRRGRDSNPRSRFIPAGRFSKPLPSASRPPLQKIQNIL